MTKVNWLMHGAGALMVVLALSGCADNMAMTADEASQLSANAPYAYADPDDYADAYGFGGYDYDFYYPGWYGHDHVRHPDDGRGIPFHDFGQGHFDGRNGLDVGNHSFAGNGSAMHVASGGIYGPARSLEGHVGGFDGHVGGFGGFGGHAGGGGRG
jgi:hypothetical protein